MLSFAGYTEEEISKMDLDNMSDDEISKLVKDKMFNMLKESLTGNSRGQMLVPKNRVGEYLTKGYEFIADLNNGKVIMKLP
ncbi:MAG: hypothetical protein ACP5RZ_04865 [Thermoplasmata archaeon]